MCTRAARNTRRRMIREEQGAVMVFFAVCIPVLILFCGLVVDVANWYEHRRHLQTQADAAALAAAGDWVLSGCDDAAIEARARQYGGWNYNKQVGGTSPDDVGMALNSATWPFDQAAPVDSNPPGGTPCETGIIDVKLTERDLGWFFGLGDIDFINVKARVRIEGVTGFSGPNLLPVSVDHVDPKAARVWFIDENTGEVLESRNLTKVTVDSGTEMAIWDNAAEPVGLAVDRDDIGVRVALSGDPDTTECGAALVECYDFTDPNQGLVYIRRWTQGGVVDPGEPPKARNVELRPGTCNDAYFYSELKDCSIGLVAYAEFASDVDPTTAPPQARLIATVGRTDYELSYNDDDDPARPFWELATGGIPLDPTDGGPMPIELRWEQTAGTIADKDCALTPCSGSFGDVQRSYIADPDRSGPIRLLQIEEDGQLFANSLEDLSDCVSTDTDDCTHDLVIKLGVEGNLENTIDRDDPPRLLKLTDSGSQTRGLDCNFQPGADDFQDEVQFGCPPEIVFTPNTGTECPKMVSADYFASYDPPYECVGNQPGNWRQKLVRGMNLRVFGTQEPTLADCETNPNYWRTAPDNDNDGLPDLDPSDPRILTLFITPFGSSEDEGRETEPILSFAAFYATGWAGQGNSTPVPCADQDKPDGNVRGGYLMGYFFKYTTPLNSGGGSGEPCDRSPESLSPCVAVLVE